MKFEYYSRACSESFPSVHRPLHPRYSDYPLQRTFHSSYFREQASCSKDVDAAEDSNADKRALRKVKSAMPFHTDSQTIDGELSKTHSGCRGLAAENIAVARSAVTLDKA